VQSAGGEDDVFYVFAAQVAAGSANTYR
jgi:hypothetical protein